MSSIYSQKLYAQDPILFEHTWYLEKVFDGVDEFYIADFTNYTATTEFFENEPYFYVYLCSMEFFYANTDFLPNNDPGFSISAIEYNVLTDVCGEHEYPDFMFIRSTMFSVFFEWFNLTNIKNPFTYAFTQNGDEATLIIENGEGMKAYYNSFPLSTQDLQEQKFIVYPNPVQETLYINRLNTGESYSAKVYSLNGSKLFDFALSDNQSEVNLQSLKQGVYFMVIESETGVKFTERIIKR